MRKRPVFMIGIAADLIGVHPQTLRMYEQKGLLRPRKSLKNTRLYSQEDVELGRYIQKLTQELGTNLAGVQRILDLEKKIEYLMSEAMHCYRHPKRETRVTCATCGRPICTECMMPTTVGIKCPEDARLPRGARVGVMKPNQILKTLLAGVGVAVVGIPVTYVLLSLAGILTFLLAIA